MTHGPCTSEIKAVNIFMNVCGSVDLHFFTRLAFHFHVCVHGLTVNTEIGRNLRRFLVQTLAQFRAHFRVRSGCSGPVKFQVSVNGGSLMSLATCSRA